MIVNCGPKCSSLGPTLGWKAGLFVGSFASMKETPSSVIRKEIRSVRARLPCRPTYSLEPPANIGLLLRVCWKIKIGLTAVRERGSRKKNGLLTGDVKKSKAWSLRNGW